MCGTGFFEFALHGGYWHYPFRSGLRQLLSHNLNGAIDTIPLTQELLNPYHGTDRYARLIF